jgi:hypothetical protein
MILIAFWLFSCAVVLLIALIVNIRQIPLDLGTAMTFGALILSLVISRRWKTLGGILLLYFMVGALNILGHLPPSPDPYAPVPAPQPTNTLVIPRKN